MIQINQIKIPANSKVDFLHIISKQLNISKEKIKDYKIIKKSIDARKKQNILYIYSVTVTLNDYKFEKKLLKSPNVTEVERKKYVFPINGNLELNHRPVVVGSGPAGLFSAFILVKSGLKPIILERGENVDHREASVEHFWNTGKLNVNSNVQFGEGGAGTFSDGKLNTGVKDKDGRNRFVLETFVQFGAPEEILYDGKPHIGTDILKEVVKNMRNYIIECGGEFRFRSLFQNLIFENNELKSINVYDFSKNEEYELPCSCLVLAIGHSARDTYEMLYSKQFPIEQKAFAVGMRVEHTQDFINKSQYGYNYKELYPDLPPSPYKVTYRAKNGRSVYSFCMCPGGYIVNASSEEHRTAVNGMSYSGRKGKHANSAIVVSVTPEDYNSNHPLAGMYFQRELEEKAFNCGNGKIPVSYFDTYENNELAEESQISNQFSIKGAYQFANLNSIFPDDINQSFIEGCHYFNEIMPEFISKDTLLAAVESRTSAPLRILRNEDFECISFAGIYPCGEGCGYAGGITSAAIDGIKVAESIVRKYRQLG